MSTYSSSNGVTVVVTSKGIRVGALSVPLNGSTARVLASAVVAVANSPHAESRRVTVGSSTVTVKRRGDAVVVSVETPHRTCSASLAPGEALRFGREIRSNLTPHD